MPYKEPDNINYNKYLKAFFYITLTIIVTYATMAVITHFSLNYTSPDYKFLQSLKSIFDTKTAVFKFFGTFLIINVIWILSAVFIKYIRRNIFF